MRAYRRVVLLAATILAAGAGLGGAGLAPSRAVAGDDVAQGGMEPQAIESVLTRQGYSDVRNLRRRGGLWLADASGPRGQRMRTVVDAFTGEITGLAPLEGSVLAPRVRKSADARM
ncbi:hypothetical protein ABEG18_20155 [Alsobacter sp. KACC 23698]|uniref:PepSY domain-containing protein n=1 Tax=Alsobacter sp. KACC 23698 TaxID=3149229 RepID=A0AAU7JD59_9HYPH